MKNKKSKINEFNILGINIQFVLTIVVAVLGILSLIVSSKLFPFFYLFASLDLFAMSYNNYLVYHKKNITNAYIMAGVILLIYSILSFIGVL